MCLTCRCATRRINRYRSPIRMPVRWPQVVGYNVQVAVETDHHLIVAHEVINVGNDRGQLARMSKQAKEVLEVDKLEAIADRGYFDGEEILACKEAGGAVTLPKPILRTMMRLIYSQLVSRRARICPPDLSARALGLTIRAPLPRRSPQSLQEKQPGQAQSFGMATVAAAVGFVRLLYGEFGASKSGDDIFQPRT